MPAPVAATVFTEAQQWFGLAREAAPGTAVLPVATAPILKGEPDDKYTYLVDKSIRGSMAEDYGDIGGTQIADFNLSGPVFLDTMCYMLDNVFGDLATTGSSPSNSTTLSAPTIIGATTCTVAAGTGFAIGQSVQIGTTTTAEVVTLSAVAGTTLTFASTPLRFSHASAQAVATVTAPFTHVFSVLNGGNGQPPTHTITHHQGITASQGARQYAYFCTSAVDFTMNAEQLFNHDTKGTSFLGQPAATPPVNTLSSVVPQPAWRFMVGIGGPASGGTQVNFVQDAAVNIARILKPYWTLTGFQSPFAISRGALAVTGKFTYFAQDDSAMLNMLNNTQPPLQITMTNGLTGANLLSCTFDMQVGAYESAKLSASDHIMYDVGFRGIGNTSNAGGTGGYSPMKVTVVNALGAL